MDKFNYIKLWFAAAGGYFMNLLGGWDVLLEVLITCVVIDYATGIIKALMGKSEKSEMGALASGVMYKGGLRKILIFIIVAVAVVADKIISPDITVIRSGAIIYYIGVEGLSILENVTLCGLPIPQKLRQTLEKIKEDDKNESTTTVRDKK